jgi:phospholipase C
MKYSIFSCFFIALGACSMVFAAGSTNKTPIEHLIVLMLENRSFDHYLGFLKSLNSAYNGCLVGQTGCSNPRDPDDATSEVFSVSSNAVNQQPSPDHSVHGTTSQIFSKTATPDVADMQGFIRSYTEHTNSADTGPTIMDCFAPENIPVMATLAQEYLTIDGWFSALPGPTMPNRAFAAAATSNGMATNDVETIVRGIPSKTMFRQLEEMGLDWRVYFQLIPSVMMFKDMRHKDARGRYHGMEKFFEDVAAGDMPEYTWLEPSYYPTPNRAPTDQHPDHDIANGEQLVKDVYEALRASPIWNTSALLIVYDEHGTELLLLRFPSP